MDKSLIFYQSDSFKKNFTYIKNNKIIYFKGNLFKGDTYNILNGNVYNPPFFKNVIFEDLNTDVDFKIAWNSTLINGYLIIPHDGSKYLEVNKKVYKSIEINNKKYNVYLKTNPIVYIIYDKYRKIDFSIIGVEKGGTSSLMLNLAKIKDIYMAIPKNHPGGEMHFLNSNILKLDSSVDKLLSYFDYNYKLVGNKNPNLIYLDYTHYYLSKLNPYLKMILVLRNPIDRAYSEWHMFFKKNNLLKKQNSGNNKTFKEAIDNELNLRLNEVPTYYCNDHHLQRGLYYKQIMNLLKYFPYQNLLIIFNEDFKTKQKETYQKIFNFLGLTNINVDKIDFEVALEGTYSKNEKEKDISYELRQKMINFFKDDVIKLEKFLNIKTNWW